MARRGMVSPTRERSPSRGFDARRGSVAHEQRRPVSATPSVDGGGGGGSSYDVSYYKQRLQRLEEKLAKEHAKVKTTVKYYEEQFEQQAKKLNAKAERDHAALNDECAKLKSQLEWLKSTQETLKSERAAREGLEKELQALREEVGEKTKSAARTENASYAEVEKLKSEIVQLKEQLEVTTKTQAKFAEEDATEVKILQDHLDSEKAKLAQTEKKLKTMQEEFIDPAEFGLVQKKLYTAESTLAKTQAQLELAQASAEETTQIKSRLDVAEKLVFSLKEKAKRVDDLEKQALDSLRDKDALRDAYAKVQNMTDKLLALSSEKEILLRDNAQHVHVEAQLAETRQELNRIQNTVHAAQMDKTNTEISFKYVVDDVARMLRDHVVSATRWEARMTAEINEANEEHAEIRRNTLNLVASAEAEAKKALRESVDMVHAARRALQDNHKKAEQVIEDVIRQERHRVSDEAISMKSELIDAERRAIKANDEIDKLSEQVRELRIELHLAKDAHAAAMATSSAAPSVVDTARGYDSDVASPQHAKEVSYRRKLRIAQFQLIVTKALRANHLSGKKPLERASLDEVERMMEMVRIERENFKSENARLRWEIIALKSAPTETSEDISEIEHLVESRNELMQQLETASDELEWSRVRIEKLENDKANSKKTSSEREKELEAALIVARNEIETIEHTIKQLKLAHVKALESVADDVGTSAKVKMDELREELSESNMKREQIASVLSRVEDQLTVCRTERDNALSNLMTVKEELVEMRGTLSEMSSSRAEILGAGREEVKARDNELLSVRQELASVRSERENLFTQIDSLKGKLVDAHSRLADIEKQKSKWESVETERKNTVNSVTKLEDELIIVTSDRDTLQSKLEVAQSERDELRKELENLLAKLSQSEEQTMSSMAQSRSEIFVANKALSQARDELERVQKAYDESVKVNEKQRIGLEISNKSLEKVREELGEREVELKLALKLAEDRDAARVEAIAAMDKSQLDLENVKLELEKTESELINLVEVVEQGQEETQSFKVKITQIQQDLAATEGRLKESLKHTDQFQAERDVANEALAEVRNELAEVQAQGQLREARLLQLQLEFDTLTDDFEEKSNELDLTEAYLQKSVAAVEKHRMERDGAARAMDLMSDELSATQSKLEAASSQLAEIYEEVTEYRQQEEMENEELLQNRASLDAVIEKFKTLRDVHEETLEKLEYEISERQREKDEYELFMANYKGEYEQHMRLLKKAASTKSDATALVSELYSILTETERAIADAQLAGNEAETRTAAQYSQQIVPVASQAAFEALLRVKTTLDSLRESLAETASGKSESIEEDIARINLQIRILVFETLMELVTQRSRVGAFKGQAAARLVPQRPASSQRSERDPVETSEVTKIRSLKDFKPNINIGLKLF